MDTYSTFLKQAKKYLSSTNAFVSFLIIIAGEFIHNQSQQDQVLGVSNIIASILLGIIIIFHSFKVYGLFQKPDWYGYTKITKNVTILVYFMTLFVQIVLNNVAIYQDKPELETNTPVRIIKLTILCILFIVTATQALSPNTNRQNLKRMAKPLTFLKKLFRYSAPVIYLILIAFLSYTLA